MLSKLRIFNIITPKEHPGCSKSTTFKWQIIENVINLSAFGLNMNFLEPKIIDYHILR